jgi:hypothetical protein
MNQPFGDVVSWDLIPRAAIATLNLMPGSNPLFGLNTLGGALAIRTKDGLHDTRHVLAGAGRRLRPPAGESSSTAATTAMACTGTSPGTAFKEDGWRDASPTRLGQMFGKVGLAGRRTDVPLSAALAGTKLTGNGLQEQRLLDARLMRASTRRRTSDEEPLRAAQPGGQPHAFATTCSCPATPITGTSARPP